MPEVISNDRLSKDFFLLKVAQKNNARMGQFHMLRAWDAYPLLSRPLSVFDSNGDTLSFLYKVIGEGTELLSRLEPGDAATIGRTLGNAFPSVAGKIALVGGGTGIAPLFLAAKTLRAARGNEIHTYLGFTDEAILSAEYRSVCDRLSVDIGGRVTDLVDPSGYDCVLSCGPEVMMRTLHTMCKASGTKLYVSLESKMACGIGVCLACGCATAGGRKKICVDGPIFPAEEVF